MQRGLVLQEKKYKTQTSLDIQQIYTWIGTPIIQMKNTHEKQVRQNQVAFFT